MAYMYETLDQLFYHTKKDPFEIVRDFYKMVARQSGKSIFQNLYFDAVASDAIGYTGQHTAIDVATFIRSR